MRELSSHPGFSAMYQEGRLTLGLYFAIESYAGSIPEMDVEQQINIAQMAESYGFSAVYFRDVPLNVPSFGDVGHIYDPWVFMGYVAAKTSRIALATGSIITTLRHPLHVAKAAASVDGLSGQRLVLGLATGDRLNEFSAFNSSLDKRHDMFQEAITVMRRVWREEFPNISTPRVEMSEADVLPKPLFGTIPIMVTGSSRQSVEWIAANSDGWLYYPQSLEQQALTINKWRSLTNGFKPFSQSLYIDLSENPGEPPTPIHLGFRAGHRFLIQYLGMLRTVGVNHVGLNLKYGSRPAHEVVQELGEFVVPQFPAN